MVWHERPGVSAAHAPQRLSAVLDRFDDNVRLPVLVAGTTAQAGPRPVTAVDVGQGDSLLVVFPDGQRLLVDGGGIPAFGHQSLAQLDIGEDVVAPYLW